MKKQFKIAFMSTWPEIPDGIATFCENLALSMPKKYLGRSIDWKVLRLNWIDQSKILHKDKVVFTVDYNNQEDFRKAKEYINQSDFDVVIIQFINSIYGNFGKDLFNFLEGLNKPVLLILHSVATLKTQSKVELKRSILKELGKFDLNEVVMSKTAQSFLVDNKYIAKNKVHLIYHGAPKFRKVTVEEKNKLRLSLGFSKNDKILFTYGVIREDKGLIDILYAMDEINKKNPDFRVKFLLCGDEQDKGKPFIKKIRETIDRFNLQEQVKFIDKFIPQEDIGEYLQATDIFITMQTNLGLHSSGTLAYALSAGAAIISTPTIHAKELLKDAGIMTKASDSKMLADCIIKILSDNHFRQKIKRNSRKIGKSILWEETAKEYLKIAIKISA